MTKRVNYVLWFIFEENAIKLKFKSQYPKSTIFLPFMSKLNKTRCFFFETTFSTFLKTMPWYIYPFGHFAFLEIICGSNNMFLTFKRRLPIFTSAGSKIVMKFSTQFSKQIFFYM